MAKQYNDDKQIAHGQLKGGVPYKIYYEGGSLFVMVFEDNGKTKQMQIPKEKLDVMIASGKIHLMSAMKYKQIESSILPDGSTKTHNADGTPKSVRKQTMEGLEEERIVVVNPDGSKTIAQDPEPTAPKIPNKKVPGPEDAAEMGLIDESDDDTESTTDHSDNDAMQAEERRQPQKPAKAKKDGKLKGDLNGDGIVNEFDDLIQEEQKKNMMVMVIFFAGIIISIFLFFFFHTLTATLFHNEPIDLIPDVIPIEKTEEDQGTQENENTSDLQEEQEDEAGNEQLETTNRTDFDPEDAVASFPMADAEHEKIAVWLFQQVRSNIYDAKRDEFDANVQLGRIADELAPAYAAKAQEIQGLTDAEKAELEGYWKETFIKQETQHVLDKDPYGSIFGGRIREVRQDPNNPLCMYVVMESISGDHQRACFAINGDASGNWVVTDIMDPTGYVSMIQAGEADVQ